MMPSNQHLSPDEIDLAVAQQQGWEESVFAAHLAGCEECRRTVEAQRAAQESLDVFRKNRSAPGRRDCPETQRWVALALGRSGADEIGELMSHAAQCDACGQILAELTATDETDAVPAWTPEIVRDVARKMAAASEMRPAGTSAPVTTLPGRRRARPLWIAWGAAAAAVVVSVSLAAVGWEKGWFRQHPPFDLLAQAYTAQRPTDLRFPDAQYAPLRTERGEAARSRMENLPAWLESKLRIGRGLEKHPGDPEWLQAKARAELLRWDFDEARKTLEQALDRAPDSASLQQDLAMTWFEVAEAHGNDAADYGRAIEFFSKVLRANANDPVALFNRALAYHRMFLYRQAAEDWQRYLRLDSKSGWAAEARKHLGEVQQKLTGQSGPGNEPRPEPGDPAVMALGNRAYGAQPLDPQVRDEARSKLTGLAKDFEEQYHDQWTTDLVGDSRKPDFSEAMQTLHRAFLQNRSGDPTTAVREARLALSRFRTIGSAPGAMRAQFELAYGLQLCLLGRECLTESRRLVEWLRGKRYPWLLAQAHLQACTGWALLGDYESAAHEAGMAVAECESHRLRTVRLRGLAFHAGLLCATGQWRKGWLADRAGLEEFWSGNYPPYRAYQFYDDISNYAEREGFPEFARVLTREAVLTIAGTADRQTEAMERYKLARLSLTTNSGAAKEEFQKSSVLFASLPSSPVMELYRLHGNIHLAQMQERNGDPTGALNQLRPIETLLSKVENRGLTALYYGVLAEAQQRLGDRSASEQSWRIVRRYSEQALSSLKTDEDRLAWSRESGGLYRQMIRLALDRNDPERGLALWEWYAASDLRRQRKTSGMKEPSEDDPEAGLVALTRRIRELAGSLNRSSVIVYVQMEDGIAAWSLDERGVTYRWLPVTKSQAENLARSFASACASPEKSQQEVAMLGRRVYDLLIAPLAAAWQRDRTIFLEADGSTARIPFHAVQTPDGLYLGEKCTIQISPGMLFAGSRMEAAGRVARPMRVLAVGNPRIAPELQTSYPPLPDALAEAQMVSSLFSGSRLLTDGAATVEAVRSALPSVDIFHFSGHAIVTLERSGLLLARSGQGDYTIPGFWTAGDLRSGSLPRCGLVVLSACSTGDIDRAGLNDPETLVRRFLASGVEAVVASRWPVDSRTTSELMTLFYAELQRGCTPGAALRAASRALRVERGKTHPRFWAAFSVFGARTAESRVFND